jgi:glutathione synthase
MGRSLGVVMDPINGIKPAKDTSLGLLLAAQRVGWALWYMELPDLELGAGRAYARMRPVIVYDDEDDWYRLGEPETHDLGSLDAILMRKDPPVDNTYIYATHILEAAERAGVIVANRPAGLRDGQEKLFTAHFPDCCAASRISMDPTALRQFVREQGAAVLKPLDGMGGESVFAVRDGDPNTSVIIETLTARGRRYAMAQRYLPEISAGDKRILVIDGEPVPYALARVPAAGETRGNLAAGGRGHAVALTDHDRWIADQIAPALMARGLWFAGLDVIGDHLTEVNFTSPTCLRELEKETGEAIAERVIASIEGRVAGR